jgi:hypothetical protein
MLHDLHAHRRKGVLVAFGLDHNIGFPAANDTEQRLPVPAVHRLRVCAGLIGWVLATSATVQTRSSIRARRDRQVLCRIAELDRSPGIQRRSNAPCVPLPKHVTSYITLWTDSFRYLPASHAMESCWQADHEANSISVRLGKKQTQNPTIDRPQSPCRSARELLLTGGIRKENHQTVTVPGARIFSSRLLREPAGRH